MSYTEIYGFNKEGNAYFAEKVKILGVVQWPYG